MVFENHIKSRIQHFGNIVSKIFENNKVVISHFGSFSNTVPTKLQITATLPFHFPEQGSVLTLYSRPAEGSVWTHPGLNNLWQPDTYVLNAKKLSRPETVTHIYAKGIGN